MAQQAQPGQSTLPTLVGLCPGEHLDQFYMPIKVGDSRRCPVPGCKHHLIVYCRADELSRRVREAYDVGREDESGRTHTPPGRAV